MIWWAVAAIAFLIVVSIQISSAEKRGEDSTKLRRNRSGCLQGIGIFVLVVVGLIILACIIIVISERSSRSPKTAPTSRSYIPQNFSPIIQPAASERSSPPAVKIIPADTLAARAASHSTTATSKPATATVRFITATQEPFYPQQPTGIKLKVKSGGYYESELMTAGYIGKRLSDGTTFYEGFYIAPNGKYYAVGKTIPTPEPSSPNFMATEAVGYIRETHDAYEDYKLRQP